MELSRLDYSQYLLVSQVNYTLTNFADHAEGLSHDAINRYLSGEKLSPRLVWEHVQSDIVASESGYILFDDTVADKNYSREIEGVRRQYSGNTHGVIRGIGIVTCVYVNPELERWWAIDYRIFDPERDGKSKLDHVDEMLSNVFYHKKLSFSTVLMDSWYATRHLILTIEEMGKLYYCPLKKNRLVDDSGGIDKYKRIEDLGWTETELAEGKTIKINKFPRNHKVKLFRVPVSSDRTDYIATNDAAQNSAKATREVCGQRWKIEQFHRELKQTTGLEKCQCRKGRIQRNHIACAMLVWVRLKHIADTTGKTVYQLKQGLLDDYLVHQLRNPAIKMANA
jgi:hypothetical protein